MASEPYLTHSSLVKKMTGPVSIYGIAEMNRRAEEQTLKIRSELSRIGCDPNIIKTNRQGIYLQMQYRYQIILADPYEVLLVLKKMPHKLSEVEVWEQINTKVRQVRQQKLKLTGWAIGCMVCMAVLLFIYLILNRL